MTRSRPAVTSRRPSGRAAAPPSTSGTAAEGKRKGCGQPKVHDRQQSAAFLPNSSLFLFSDLLICFLRPAFLPHKPAFYSNVLIAFLASLKPTFLPSFLFFPLTSHLFFHAVLHPSHRCLNLLFFFSTFLSDLLPTLPPSNIPFHLPSESFILYPSFLS